MNNVLQWNVRGEKPFGFKISSMLFETSLGNFSFKAPSNQILQKKTHCFYCQSFYKRLITQRKELTKFVQKYDFWNRRSAFNNVRYKKELGHKNNNYTNISSWKNKNSKCRYKRINTEKKWKFIILKKRLKSEKETKLKRTKNL